MFSVDWPVEIKILFPLTTHHFHDSVSLNAFASKAATNAVVVRHSSMDLQIKCGFTNYPLTLLLSINIVIFGDVLID